MNSSTPKRVSFGSTHGSMVETLIIDDTMPADEKNFYRNTLLNEQKNNNQQNNNSGGGDNNNIEEQNNSKTSKGRTGENRVTFATTNTELSEDNTTTTVITETQSNSAQDGGIVTSSKTTKTTTTILRNNTPNNVSPSPVSPSPTEVKPGPPIIRLQRSRSTESSDNPFTADGELSKKAEYILRHSTISRTEIRISDPDLSRGNVEEEIQMTEMSQQSAAPKTGASGDARPNEINMKENGKVEQPLTPQSVEVEVATANASQPQPQQAEQVKLKDPKCKCCVIM